MGEVPLYCSSLSSSARGKMASPQVYLSYSNKGRFEDHPLDARREPSALEGWILEILRSERTQGFTADPVYGRARRSAVLGAFKTYRGTSRIRKRPRPKDSPMTLGIGLRQVPRGVRFLISDVHTCRKCVGPSTSTAHLTNGPNDAPPS